MKWERIWALAIRYLKQVPTNFNKIVSLFYWPLLDIVVVGLIGQWCSTTAPECSNIGYALISGVALWQLVIRANYSVCQNLLEEIEDRNLANLFSTPLTPLEWVFSTIVESGITATIVGLYCVGIVLVIFGFNIFSIGFWLIPIFPLLILVGLSLGLFTGALLIMWGMRVHVLVWTIGWLFAPLSCAYYSIDVLPNWMQKFVSLFPASYIFEAIRKVVLTGFQPVGLLFKGFILTLFYFILSLAFFIFMFKKSRNSGLAKLSG